MIQPVVAERRLAYAEALGRDNPADLYTKHLDAATVGRHVDKPNGHHKDGRSSVAPELHRVSISWDEYMRQQFEHNLLQLETVSRNIRSQAVKQQSRLHGRTNGYLMVCTKQEERGAYARELHSHIATAHAQIKWNATKSIGTYTRRCKGWDQQFTATTATTTTLPLLEIGKEKKQFEAEGDNEQQTFENSEHYVEDVEDHHSKCGAQDVAQRPLRYPLTKHWSKSHEEGHDTSLHNRITTVSDPASQRVYRGCVSNGFHFSHCLGAASEGGGGQTYTGEVHVQTYWQIHVQVIDERIQ